MHRLGADTFFFCNMIACAYRQGQLIGIGFRQYGTTEAATQMSCPLKLCQIAPNGSGTCEKCRAKLFDRHAFFGAEQAQNILLSFKLQHMLLLFVIVFD